jgi:uncharacterized protein YkwD
MRRSGLVAALFTLALLLPAQMASADGPVRSARTAKAVEQKLVACANRERAARGIDPLRVNGTLGRAARLHARNMARHNFFDHTDPWGDGPQERVDRLADQDWGVGENIHQYYRSVKKICSDWMKSAGHRANILNRDNEAIGAGYSRDRGGRRHLYVLVFGFRF